VTWLEIRGKLCALRISNYEQRRNIVQPSAYSSAALTLPNDLGN